VRIAILDDYQDVVKSLTCFDILKGHDVRILTETYKDVGILAEQIRDVEMLVLIRERTVINQEILSKLPNLKLISQTGKISNHLDIEACTKFGVHVAEGIGSPVAPAELCWALIMAASRHLTVYSSSLRQGRWQDSGPLGLGRALDGLTIGIWGYGKIGRRIARYAQAFAMDVLIWGRASSRMKAIADGFSAASSKSEFFASADILSLHLRLNEKTKACVRAEDLALMKADSLFVNISRSGLVEKNALYDELQKNPTKRAAIDVFDSEPAHNTSEPLLSLPNVLGTPHLGYVEKNSYELYFRKAFENVAAYAEGKPQNLVNGK
jgi:D-3-phosphoglycerate dehydrogenase